jgi:hypothetical protein
MNARVNEPANDAAAGHDQHACHRHRGIYRIDVKAGMEQNEKRAADAE